MEHNVTPDATPAPLSAEDRREFLVRAGKVAVTAPAAALLLRAAVKPATALAYTAPTGGGTTPSDGSTPPTTSSGTPASGGLGGAKA